MFSKIVLCVTNGRLLAGRWQFGRLLAHRAFRNDAQGYEEFSRYLQQHAGTEIYMLVDAVEEDYRLESLPHTMGNARREMINRKLGLIYRGTSYRAAHFINRETTKRKDDRFLFVALTYEELLQPWIERLQALQMPLVGVYLLSMVSQHFVRKLKVGDAHLLLTERLSGGLRQTYLHNGRLRISRLVPYTEESHQAPSQFYATETEKARLYLISQRCITRETPLTVLIPSIQDDCLSLCNDMEQMLGLTCNTIDLGKLARSYRLDPVLLRDNPELLHMQLVVGGTVPDNLAPSALGRHHQISVIRRGINAASAVVLLAGFITAVVLLKQAYDNRVLAEQAALATMQQQHLYDEVAKDFPATPIPAGDLQTVAEMEAAIAQNAVLPQRALQVISRAVSASPEIDVNRLAWMLSNEADPKDGERSGVPVVINTARPAAATFVPEPGKLYEVIFLNGEIRRFNGNYRAALESVGHLVERLRTDSAVAQVDVLQAPVNVSSYSNLQGSTTDEHTAQVTPALFKLRVILKREEQAA
ncbi:MAG TPA: hypothetical protein VIK69_02540 [Methylophilaceae bacterium]|jgi:hypothetical protein